MLKTLDQLCIEHKTDKATVHPAKGHGYAPVYGKLLPLSPQKMLEIGVGGGESIRVWMEYFPDAQIYGVDTVRDTNIFNIPGKPFERYTFICGDQSDSTFWRCFLADYGTDWDIIIDDGGHYSNQVITSFQELWPAVVSGGVYCVEDLGVASSPGTIFVPDGWRNHIDWLRDMMHKMNREDTDIESIHYSKELAIFTKK